MRCLLLISLAALTGCTQQSHVYPSLLPRAIEGASLAEPVRTAPVAEADPALDSRIAALRATLDSNTRAFASAAQDAEAKIAVARGLPAGSDPWLDAQTALAGLDTLRAPALTALSELEELAIRRGEEGKPPYPALDALIASGQAAGLAQAQRIQGLEAALAAP